MTVIITRILYFNLNTLKLMALTTFSVSNK